MRKHILAEMAIRSTEELTEIWIRNNRAEWTDEAFDVIKEILHGRLGELPPQNFPSNQSPNENWTQMFSFLFQSSVKEEGTPSHSRPKSRYLLIKEWVTGIYMGGMLLYLLYLAIYEGANGRQPEPGLDLWLMLLLSSLMFIWLGIDLFWKTWRRPAEFIDHLEKNVIPMQKKRTLIIFRWMVPTSAKFLLWYYRLISPIIILLGFVFLILSYSLWQSLKP